VHKIARHPSRPTRLFLQNHRPVSQRRPRRSWQDIANGVPSDFGFAMASDPNDADTAHIAPLESDESCA
jgi:hypothetical protein